MRVFEGRVTEVRVGPGGRAIWVACPERSVPAAGQWVVAWATADVDAPLAEALYPADIGKNGFLAVGGADALPGHWSPGEPLRLRGPLGRGFGVPDGARRLALAALGATSERLLPLIGPALEEGAEVTLFTDGPLPDLPAALEVSPLSELPSALAWADFLALDLPAGALPTLRERLGLAAGSGLPCPSQALVRKSMPCGAVAGCGACAVPARRGWLLACKDGPVFNLNELAW